MEPSQSCRGYVPASLLPHLWVTGPEGHRVVWVLIKVTPPVRGAEIQPMHHFPCFLPKLSAKRGHIFVISQRHCTSMGWGTGQGRKLEGYPASQTGHFGKQGRDFPYNHSVQWTILMRPVHCCNPAPSSRLGTE